MLTHKQAVEVLQQVMDIGGSGWLRPLGAQGWAVWWEEPGLLVMSGEDFAAWSPLIANGTMPELAVNIG